MEIRNIKDIQKLKNSRDLDKIIIYSKYLKYKSLLQYALKYSYWALKQHGELIIKDNGPFHIGIRPYKINIYQVNQIVFKFLKDSVELVERDFKKGIIKLKVIDKTPNQNINWSCGIIYSGNSSEQEQLLKCLNGIYNQNQFNKMQSEVLICGPKDVDYSFLDSFPKNARVIFFDNHLKNKRFLISKKKNFLITHFKNENCLLLHTRIILDNNTLNQIPEDFDYLAPFVYTKNKLEKKRYLDFLNNGSYDPTRVVKELYIPRNYNPKKYLKYIKYGLPFVDGGIMLFKRDVLNKCPLNNNLAWFENEDVDLSARLHLNGFLIDYAYDVQAQSITNKVQSNRLKDLVFNNSSFRNIFKIRYFIKSYFTNIISHILYNYYKLK
jgi:hypothetical protein